MNSDWLLEDLQLLLLYYWSIIPFQFWTSLPFFPPYVGIFNLLIRIPQLSIITRKFLEFGRYLLIIAALNIQIKTHNNTQSTDHSGRRGWGLFPFILLYYSNILAELIHTPINLSFFKHYKKHPFKSVGAWPACLTHSFTGSGSNIHLYRDLYKHTT